MPGIVKDIAIESAAGIGVPGVEGDDDFDGLVGTITGIGLKRMGDVASRAFGENSGFGAAVNIIPEGFRNPVATAGEAVIDTTEFAYREGVGEPLSTVQTAIGLSSQGDTIVDRFGTFFQGETWKDAYKIAQDRSPGQAFSMNLSHVDITDPEAVNEYVGTDFYKYTSGFADAVLRMRASPDIAAGKAFTAARTNYLVRPIKSAEQVDDYFRGKHWDGVNSYIDEIPGTEATATRIRDRFFRDHAQGDVISQRLAEAQNHADREKVMRFFMGDLEQLDGLYATDAALASRLQGLIEEQAFVRTAKAADGTLFADEFLIANAPIRLEGIKAEIEDVTTQLLQNDRYEGAFNAIGKEIRLTKGGDIREAITSNGFYQTNPLTRPVRVFADKSPHRVLDFNRSNASEQLDRMGRQAGIPEQRRAVLRSEMDAAPVERRMEIYKKAEREAFRAKAKQYGLTKTELDTLLESLNDNQKAAIGLADPSMYDAKGRFKFRDPDGELIDVPGLLTQTANSTVMPNWKQVDRVLKKAGERKYRLTFGEDAWVANSKTLDWADKTTGAALRGVEMPKEVMTSIMKVWKPAVLLRPAWTVRVVALDEQFRMIAKLGAMVTMYDKLAAGKNLTAAVTKELFGNADTALGKIGPTKTGAGVGAGLGLAAAGPMGALVGGAAGAGLGKAMGAVKEVPFESFIQNGYKVTAAFGAPDDSDNIWRILNSADEGTREILDATQQGIVSRWRQMGGWESRGPGNAGYAKDWEWAVNKQILQDPMARQLVEGKSVDEVVEWLRNTPEGVKYNAKIPYRRDLDTWVASVKEQVDDYIPDVGDLRARAAAGRLKHADLDEIVPIENQPTVHGQSLQQILGRGQAVEGVTGLVNKMFHLLGTLPTDHLSRNPYFARVYEADMRRKLASVPEGRIKESTLRKMENASRETALRETQDLLYDFAERSEFADMTRMMIPFFPAFQEVLTRWAGLAIENPVFAARAAKVLQSPAKLPEDGIGLLGFKAAWYTTPEGDGFLQMRIPEWSKGLVNHGLLKGAVDSQGYVRIDPKQFSMVGTGTPGFGPFVQIAMSEVVKRQPSLEDSVGFILPYGPVADWKQAFMPAAAKRLEALGSGEESRAYANAYARIITTKLTEMREGKIPPVDMDDPVARSAFLEQVQEETDQFFKFRAVASWISPVAPIFDSPYQAHIDAYRAKKLENPVGADDWFLNEFGEEFFALTQSFTKSTNGIPPTLKGLEVEGKYKDLLTRYPEFGGLIAGAEGSGLQDKFSRAMYDRQLGQEFVEGSGEMARERFSAVEIATNPEVRLTWSKFSRAMDKIEAIRLSQGLPNLRVKEAEGLAEAKRQIVLALAAESPAWAQEYFTTDVKAWSRKIEGLSAIANNKDLAGRPAIAGLRNYLQARELVLKVLSQRESTDITSQSNQDVMLAWETVKSQLAADPAFGELLQRWLDNDPMGVDTMIGVAA